MRERVLQPLRTGAGLQPARQHATRQGVAGAGHVDDRIAGRRLQAQGAGAGPGLRAVRTGLDHQALKGPAAPELVRLTRFATECCELLAVGEETGAGLDQQPGLVRQRGQVAAHRVAGKQGGRAP